MYKLHIHVQVTCEVAGCLWKAPHVNLFLSITYLQRYQIYQIYFSCLSYFSYLFKYLPSEGGKKKEREGKFQSIWNLFQIIFTFEFSNGKVKFKGQDIWPLGKKCPLGRSLTFYFEFFYAFIPRIVLLFSRIYLLFARTALL